MKPTIYAVVGALAAVLITTTSALAGSGVGGVFNLGQTNTVSQKSTLTGATSDVQLLVQNTGTGTALNLVVAGGAAPFKVNSATKVASLNADQLDGLDSASLQKRVTGACAAGHAIKLVNANGSVACEPVGGAGGSWSLAGNAGTTPGTNFLGTTDDKALELKVNGQRALRLVPNTISPNVIGGFVGNGTGKSSAQGATIAGGGTTGSSNFVFADFGTVSGGKLNKASGAASSVGGGAANTASAEAAVVAGGEFNTASGLESFVGSGEDNNASGPRSTVAGGGLNTASGFFSTVPGGDWNTAGGNYSFAAGRHASATEDGAFVWSDSTGDRVISPKADTFTVQASGGIWLGTTSTPSIVAGHFIDTSTGGFLSSAGVWTNSSDRAKKHDFRPLDKRFLLERLARMPVTSWSYKAETPSVRHIGPIAQDFYQAFGLGLDNKHITTIDEGGIALAAIQGLYRQNTALQRENRTLRDQLGAQNARLTRLERAVTVLSH
jgi:hypothetical protein